MLQTLKKFFAFCGEDNRKLFVTSIWLGVVSAICSAMRIPAAAIVIQALLERDVTMATLWTSLGIIVASLIVTIAINMKAKLIKEEFRMVIQEKVQNRSLKMTRENLIFAKTIGTLYTIGADRNVISQMVEETKNTETDILPYLRDRLMSMRSGYQQATKEHETLSRLLDDCNAAISGNQTS